MLSSKPLLIGFAGKAGAGKGKAAEYLMGRHGFVRVKLAGPLKDMLRAIGLSEEEIEGALKEEACDKLCGRTPRWAMQSLGTEWGRELIHHDFWVTVWKDRVRKLGPNACVVVDDVRFQNEEAALRELGGVLVKVNRPQTKSVAPPRIGLADRILCVLGFRKRHVSEAYEVTPDFVIENDGTLADLYRRVDAALFPPVARAA